MALYSYPINIDVNTWREIITNSNIIDEKTSEILLCLLKSDKCEASGGEIALALKYSHHAPLNKIIPDFSKRIIKNYPNVILPKREDGHIMYWHIPFLGTEMSDKFTWQLRNELKEALLQVHDNIEVKLPEEFIDEIYYEGKLTKSLINTYERNPKARAACIKHYGCKCIICGFDFEKNYGEIGKGIIHVHHKNRLSDINNEHEIDPIKDLAPVCPNCHTVIHSKKEMYSIEEMLEIIKREPHRATDTRP
jgi:5-methylcytosine-specific restriction protein A